MCHAAAAELFLLQPGTGAGTLVLSGMDWDVGLDLRHTSRLKVEVAPWAGAHGALLLPCWVFFFAGRQSCWLSPGLQPAQTSCGQLGNESSRFNVQVKQISLLNFGHIDL